MVRGLKYWGLLCSLLVANLACAAGTSGVGSKGKDSNLVSATFQTPTRKATPEEVPRFVDDLDFAWLDQAIQRQLARYQKLKLTGSIYYGSDQFPLTKIVESLEHLGVLSQEFKSCLRNSPKLFCQDAFHNRVISDFHVYLPNLTPKDPRYGQKEFAFFTGYYTPLLRATSEPSPQFPHAIHARPPSASLAKSTRVQIDFDQVLKGIGTELFYVQDLFELYVMHVEGGGKVEVETPRGKEATYLTFDGTNNQAFRFISKYMLEKGYIKERSNAAQHQFLKDHPDKQREIYEYCPSYVYFKVSTTPPLGNDGVPLTDNRSVALDSAYYRFKGAPAFIISHRPADGQGEKEEINKTIRFQPYSRFVVDQDTGGAIEGKARIDVYWGEGEYAALAAHNTATNGALYFLVKK
ncbi:MAG: MltA domain-containing protein [Bdellovibrionales bacterium]|nr:MltA domain-containing protein [Bdellovibrionales bacterium]